VGGAKRRGEVGKHYDPHFQKPSTVYDEHTTAAVTNHDNVSVMHTSAAYKSHR